MKILAAALISALHAAPAPKILVDVSVSHSNTVNVECLYAAAVPGNDSVFFLLRTRSEFEFQDSEIVKMTGKAADSLTIAELRRAVLGKCAAATPELSPE